jgi:hypothetical protein
MAAAISAACVSSADLDELHGVAAGEGKELELAILFSDIRNFTTHSEKNLPYDVVHMLNRHFVAAAEPVLNNNGFIDGVKEGALSKKEFDELNETITKTPDSDDKTNALKLISTASAPSSSASEQELINTRGVEKDVNQKVRVDIFQSLVCSGDKDAPSIVRGLTRAFGNSSLPASATRTRAALSHTIRKVALTESKHCCRVALQQVASEVRAARTPSGRRYWLTLKATFMPL